MGLQFWQLRFAYYKVTVKYYSDRKITLSELFINPYLHSMLISALKATFYLVDMHILLNVFESLT